jgi:transcriptional regulator with XRE-family HTH domain
MASTSLTRRYGPRSWLEDERHVHMLAKCLVAGLTSREIAAMLCMSHSSVSNYRHDQRVVAECLRLAEDRILRVTNRLDTIILERLDAAGDEMPVSTLLAIRREFMGNTLRVELGQPEASPDVINEAAESLENDPDFASALADLLARQ